MTPPIHARPSVVALLLAAIAVAVTWPLATVLGSALPGNLGDPLLNSWTLGWGSERLAAGLRGFWDGRAFFPYPDTVAFSEHLLGITIFVAPVYWLSQNAVLTYNVAYLASFVHAGLAMWLLVRRLTGRTDVALIAALAFAFPLLRTTGQHTFLHMQVSGWVPLCFWALHRYADGRRLTDALLAAGTFVLAVLTSLYFAFVLLVPVTYAAFVLLRPSAERRLDWRMVAHAAVAAALAAAVLAPVLLRYQRVSAAHGFERTTAESARYSADVVSYVGVWHQSDFRPFLRDEQTVVRALFPGLIITALAAAACAWRRPRWTRHAAWTWGAPLAGGALAAIGVLAPLPQAGTIGLALFLLRALLPLPASTAGLYGRVAALAFLLSLGPVPAFDGTAMAASGPHAWLLDLVPGASGLRMPARHGMMVSFALAVLAAYGATRVLAWRPLLDRAGPALTGVAALVVADGYAGPLTMAPFEARGSAEDRRVHAWMASEGPGPVMHLPIADADLRPEVANASVQLTFHYATLLHGQPTVTGGTDFMPRLGRWLHGEGSPFRTPMDAVDALDVLRRLGIRYVLLHRDEFRSPMDAESYEARLLRATRHIRRTDTFETMLVIELHDPLPRLDASAPPPGRGPPQRLQCRYLDAGVPDPQGADPARPTVAATWACPVPAGSIEAVRWTFDVTRPESWPARLRVEAAGAVLLPDFSLTSRLADAMVTRPASAPQISVPLPVPGATTLLVRTWGARASRSTPPFWLEAWTGSR
ncbi:MAG: hypothetical protein ABIT71_16890 [Vicinamibacteraceae bacterium]